MPSSHKDSEQVLRTAITNFFSNTDNPFVLPLQSSVWRIFCCRCPLPKPRRPAALSWLATHPQVASDIRNDFIAIHLRTVQAGVPTAVVIVEAKIPAQEAGSLIS